MTTSHDVHDVDLEDGTLRVTEDGPREAPALLLVHGSASSLRSWDALVPPLTGAHRVLRVDLLGHGRSAKPDDRSYAIPDQARRVGEALDRLGVERAVVAGHSSGGVVATALAERRPELVAGLALINTGPAMDAFLATDSGADSGSDSGGLDPARWPPSEELVRRFAGTGFSRPGFVVPPELVEDMRGMTFHSLTASMGGTTAYLTERPLPERLVEVGRPLLVLYGEEDRRWRPASFADYRTVPGARVVPLPGLGHSPLLEDPERTAVPLLAFTAGLALEG
ncbi:alpha/beta fold hydrolase [Streptomyces triticirhizae]|uniref:Alpha/beta fold hydrolase n=1 Tax=Streptomyces triticirhizae TaxID=2483353 RepID=A0A3M2LVT0_9ACTN|nr:alpha/beta fold hydrolase [Streptomyces triticirhizae]RMI41312.1 alpha/beta fold hydrolase [Streptomyces triticirhizae]